MKTLNKNIRREFKISFARFVSVSALLMLGVFVLIGLNVTGPDMRQTAQKAYVRENLADAEVVSTIGLNQKDQSFLRKFSQVKKIEFGHTLDVMSGDTPLRIESVPNELSKMTVVEGRTPNNSNEIIVSSNLKKRYKLGSSVKVASAKAGQSLGLNQNKFKIVGFATSTEFLRKDNIGDTSAGSGSLGGFAYVKSNVFSTANPNVARIDFTNVKGKAYSDHYEEGVATQVDKIQPKLNQRNTDRVNIIRADLNDRIKNGQEQVQDSENAIQNGNKRLDLVQKQLKQQAKLVEDTKNQVAIATVNEKQNDLNKQRRLLSQKQTEVVKAKSEMNDAKESEKQLSNITLTIQGRNDYNSGYNNYGEDAQRIDALGRVFPIFFFLIAILVSFTTMRRMVEEKRIEMGTLRALGYTSNQVMREFLIYSFLAAVAGTPVGSLLGLLMLPRIIFKAYTANFTFSNLQLAPHLGLVAVSLIISLLSTVLASWLAARKELKEIPAELMLPKPPASGSRILLERIVPIWKRLSFSHKVTARNLFRYKSRMFMTIIGVAGATALMITGFGIRDSLNTIVNRQFGQISKYDLITVYNPNAKKQEVRNAQDSVEKSAKVKSETVAYFENVYATSKGNYAREDISLMVPNRPGQLNRFIKLTNYRTGKKLNLTSDGAVVSEKLARLQNVKVGGYFTVHATDGTKHRIKVAGITTMYAGHYIYMTRSYYQKVYDKVQSNNAYLVTLHNPTNTAVNNFACDFNQHMAAIQTIQAQESKKTITNILSNLNNLILVLVVSASLLSLVVLYTLTNINVSERIRELSTLKVLGFYPNEVLGYVYRETNILTGAGILVGLLVGYEFHEYIMQLLPPSTAMVAPGITWTNVIISVALTVLFSFVIMILMNRKIQKVDMLEALKSID